jgi:hypothetical protein
MLDMDKKNGRQAEGSQATPEMLLKKLAALKYCYKINRKSSLLKHF